MKDLFETKCPQCGHSAHAHTYSKCQSRRLVQSFPKKYSTCACPLSQTEVLLTIIAQLEHAASLAQEPASAQPRESGRP